MNLNRSKSIPIFDILFNALDQEPEETILKMSDIIVTAAKIIFNCDSLQNDFDYLFNTKSLAIIKPKFPQIFDLCDMLIFGKVKQFLDFQKANESFFEKEGFLFLYLKPTFQRSH